LSLSLKSRLCAGPVMELSVSCSSLELPPRSGNELNEGGKEEKEGGAGIGGNWQGPSCGSVGDPHRPGRLI
jgi:hypothetical protein